MISFYVFIILLLSGFCSSINSTSSTLLTSTTSILNFNDTTTTIQENQTNQTLIPTSSVFNTTTITFTVNTTINSTINTTITSTVSTTINSSLVTMKPNETSASTVSINTTSINESSTSAINSNRPSKPWSMANSWLVIALPVTVVVVISIGFAHYYRRRHSYRRFLGNWRSSYDDVDNIVLQLEQPEVVDSQWPSRISFA